MAKQFKNISSLVKHLNKVVAKTLQEDTALHEQIKKVGEDAVQDIVYDAYDPKQYERTGKLKESWEVSSIKDGIVLENTRQDGEVYIPEVIETGQGYTYSGYGYDYEKPRRFIEETRNRIKDRQIHVKGLKNALKRRGFSVK